MELHSRHLKIILTEFREVEEYIGQLHYCYARCSTSFSHFGSLTYIFFYFISSLHIVTIRMGNPTSVLVHLCHVFIC